MQILRRASAANCDQRVVESERAEIEVEAQQLRLSLEKQEARLPEIEAELAQADAFRDSELAAARRAEDERALLGEEARRVARGERWVADGGSWRRAGGLASDEEEAPDEGADSDGAANPQSAIHPSQGAIDFEELEARRLRGELDEMEACVAAAARQLPDPTAVLGTASLEEAEMLTVELREEIAEERAGLEAAEAERQRIAEDRSTLDKEEAPLRDWVDHVERELRAARAESAELQAELVAASDRRAEMQRDDLQSLPLRQAGVDMKQVWELEHHAQECQARKAALREDISKQRTRRDLLLSRPSGHERHVLVSETEGQGIVQLAQLVQLGPPHAPSQDASPAWSPRQAEEALVNGPTLAPPLPPHPFCEPTDSLRATPQDAGLSQQESFASGDGAAGNYWDDLEEF